MSEPEQINKGDKRMSKRAIDTCHWCYGTGKETGRCEGVADRFCRGEICTKCNGLGRFVGFTDEAVCPHCGEGNHVKDEDYVEEGDSFETQCSDCEKSFIITMSYDISFSTKAVKG